MPGAGSTVAAIKIKGSGGLAIEVFLAPGSTKLVGVGNRVSILHSIFQRPRRFHGTDAKVQPDRAVGRGMREMSRPQEGLCVPPWTRRDRASSAVSEAPSASFSKNTTKRSRPARRSGCSG